LIGVKLFSNVSHRGGLREVLVKPRLLTAWWSCALQVAQGLMKQLDVPEANLVSGAYMDLLLQKTSVAQP